MSDIDVRGKQSAPNSQTTSLIVSPLTSFTVCIRRPGEPWKEHSHHGAEIDADATCKTLAVELAALPPTDQPCHVGYLPSQWTIGALAQELSQQTAKTYGAGEKYVAAYAARCLGLTRPELARLMIQHYRQAREHTLTHDLRFIGRRRRPPSPEKIEKQKRHDRQWAKREARAAFAWRRTRPRSMPVNLRNIVHCLTPVRRDYELHEDIVNVSENLDRLEIRLSELGRGASICQAEKYLNRVVACPPTCATGRAGRRVLEPCCHSLYLKHKHKTGVRRIARVACSRWACKHCLTRLRNEWITHMRGMIEYRHNTDGQRPAKRRRPGEPAGEKPLKSKRMRLGERKTPMHVIDIPRGRWGATHRQIGRKDKYADYVRVLTATGYLVATTAEIAGAVSLPPAEAAARVTEAIEDVNPIGNRMRPVATSYGCALDREQRDEWKVVNKLPSDLDESRMYATLASYGITNVKEGGSHLGAIRKSWIFTLPFHIENNERAECLFWLDLHEGNERNPAATHEPVTPAAVDGIANALGLNPALTG